MTDKINDMKRYKRMLQISDDPRWILKIAEEEAKEPVSHFRFPSVKTFLSSLLFANSKPFRANVQQGMLATVVARELSSWYEENVDLDQPALKSMEQESDLKKALAEDLYTFSSSDLTLISQNVKRAMKRLGDHGVAALASDLTNEKLKDLIDFALARAYVVAYWQFLFKNPVASVLVENKGNLHSSATPFTISGINKLAAEDDPNAGKIYETSREDEIEDDRLRNYEPRNPDGTKKEKTSIRDFPGTKIRLSQLIEAFKVSRAKWAGLCAADPENSTNRFGWVCTDANIDYLERAFAALQAFVQDNSNNSFLKWHGQRIGNGDVFVVTNGKDFDTLKQMSPPTFYVPADGSEMAMVKIPVNHWDPERKDEHLTTSLPEFGDIYDLYLHQKMSDPAKYREEAEEKTLADFKIMHSQTLSNAKSQSLTFSGGEASTAFETLREALVNVDESGKMVRMPDDEARGIANQIWTVAHSVITESANSAENLGHLSDAISESKNEAGEIETIGDRVYAKLMTISEIARHIDTTQAHKIKRVVIRDLVQREFGLPAGLKSFAAGFTNFSALFSANVTDAMIGTQVAAFSDPQKGRDCNADAIEDVRAAVARVDAKVKFQPGPTSLRDPSSYKIPLLAVYEELFRKYSPHLTRDGKGNLTPKGKRAIRMLVEHAVNRTYPDVGVQIGIKHDISSPSEMAEGHGTLRGSFESSYYASTGTYTSAQAKLVKDILTAPHYDGQYTFAEEEFDKIQHTLSNRVQKERTYHDIKSAYDYLLKKNREEGGRLFPLAADPAIRKKLSADPRYHQKQSLLESHALVETVRVWIAKNMGDEGSKTRKIKEMLGESGTNNTMSMALYVHLADKIAAAMQGTIVKSLVERFPTGGKDRGINGLMPDQLEQLENEVPDIEWLQGKVDRGSAGSDATGFGPESRENIAETEVSAHIDFLVDNRFRTVRTRKVSYETTEEAKAKSRVGLSTHTFGGFIQQMFVSKSPYLPDIMKDPVKFRNWFVASCAASFGNQIGNTVKTQMSGLWSGPNAKYKSIEDFMEKVGAFADPTWALSPQTWATKNLEVSKRKSGYIEDVPDTAEDHLFRAAYNLNTLNPSYAEDLLKTYFEKREETFLSSFPGADRALLKDYLIHKFKADPSIKSRKENQTNNPFGSMTVEKMRDALTKTGITNEDIEGYFAKVKLEKEEAESRKMSYMQGGLLSDPNTEEYERQQKIILELEDATRYTLDGRVATSNRIIDAITPAGASPLVVTLVEDAKVLVKRRLADVVGTDVTKFIMVYGDLEAWKKEVTEAVTGLDSRFAIIQQYFFSQISHVERSVETRASLVKRLEQAADVELGLDDSEVGEPTPEKEKEDAKKKVVDEFATKTKVKPVVRRRQETPAVETIEGTPVAAPPQENRLRVTLDAYAKAVDSMVMAFRTKLYDAAGEGAADAEGEGGEQSGHAELWQKDPRQLEAVLVNVKDFTDFLRDIDPTTVRAPAAAEFITRETSAISIMTYDDFVKVFSSAFYRKLTDRTRAGLGLVLPEGDEGDVAKREVKPDTELIPQLERLAATLERLVMKDFVADFAIGGPGTHKALSNIADYTTRLRAIKAGDVSNPAAVSAAKQSITDLDSLTFEQLVGKFNESNYSSVVNKLYSSFGINATAARLSAGLAKNSKSEYHTF